MRHISAKFVPRLLSDDQKAHRVSICRELKQQAKEDHKFISKIATGDETWVYDYDPKTKQQSSQWKSTIFTAAENSGSRSQQRQVYINHFFDIQ
jgi:histone-lysine N-methyltransferase SETMAR